MSRSKCPISTNGAQRLQHRINDDIRSMYNGHHSHQNYDSNNINNKTNNDNNNNASNNNSQTIDLDMDMDYDSFSDEHSDEQISVDVSAILRRSSTNFTTTNNMVTVKREPLPRKLSAISDKWHTSKMHAGQKMTDRSTLQPIVTNVVSLTKKIKRKKKRIGSDTNMTSRVNAIATDVALTHALNQRLTQSTNGTPIGLEPTVTRKTHKCMHIGCNKVYGKSSHLKAHYRYVLITSLIFSHY